MDNKGLLFAHVPKTKIVQAVILAVQENIALVNALKESFAPETSALNAMIKNHVQVDRFALEENANVLLTSHIKIKKEIAYNVIKTRH